MNTSYIVSPGKSLDDVFRPDSISANTHAVNQELARVLRNGSFLVDGVVTRDADRRLGARVDVLPPFTGG